jgi:prepilin-type N-terminal cleavage/methylation domain-containing protein
MSADGARGFTLLETLVAFAMLSVVLAAAYAAMGSAGRAAGAGGDRLDALARAENALARAAAAPLSAGAVRRAEGDWVETVTVAPFPSRATPLWRVEARAEHAGGAAATLATVMPGRAR